MGLLNWRGSRSVGAVKIPEFGVVITEGLPGSGKSFFEMSRALEVIVRERRPVFTNLPLRFRVVRRWLRNRGGEALAGLIFPLTEDHFRAFLKRCNQRAKYRDQLRTEWASEGRPFSEVAFERAWYAKAGPDVVRGPGANWIYEASVIVIDEGHHWFPMAGQKDETPDLLGYLTMLRHSLHQLRIITQDRMQISITFRRLCQSFWYVRQRGDDRLAWGIKFRHLGITGFAYVRRTPEQEEAFGKNPDVVGGFSESDVIFPWLPSQSWKFRLYDSFTHIGGLRRMRNQLSRVRRLLGVRSPDEIAQATKLTKGEKVRLIGRVVFWMVAAFPLLFLGFAFGRATAPKGPSAVAAKAAAEALKPWYEGAKLRSVSRAGVSVGNSFVQKGGLYGKAVLLGVDVPKRRTVWVADGAVWVWKFGTERPERSAGVKDFIASAHRTLEARARRNGAGDGKGGPTEAGPVGSPESHDSGGVDAVRGSGSPGRP